MRNRREFLKSAASGVAAAVGELLFSRMANASKEDPPIIGQLDTDLPEALPGKKALIKRSFRPPNYETPASYFNHRFTPNDAFFVRYHLANIPNVAVDEWTLDVRGESIEKPLSLTLAELKNQFKPIEINAVCQCSGNRRGLVKPHVPGVQWGYGAMGNAHWKGVRLYDILKEAGVKPDAVEVVFNGADSAVIAKTPDFTKSLPLAKALDQNTLIAFEMNGEPLPHWNGFPARLIVPGWTATYWIKHLTKIEVVAKPYDGFWMKTAYRIPNGLFPGHDQFPTQQTAKNTPITEIMVNSLVTYPENGQHLALGQAVVIKGIAWDGGYGIRQVEVSTDAGKTWQLAALDKDEGRFSWRQWQFRFRPHRKGVFTLLIKATNRIGMSQPDQMIPNPAGYHHNAIEHIAVTVV